MTNFKVVIIGEEDASLPAEVVALVFVLALVGTVLVSLNVVEVGLATLESYLPWLR